jgi:hypothetical protein
MEHAKVDAPNDVCRDDDCVHSALLCLCSPSCVDSLLESGDSDAGELSV